MGNLHDHRLEFHIHIDVLGRFLIPLFISLSVGLVGCGGRRALFDAATSQIPAAVAECTQSPNTIAVANTLDNLRWIFLINFLLILVGAVVARLINFKLGLTIGAIAALGIALAAAAIYYLQWLAITGFAIIVASIIVALALLVHYYWRKRKPKPAAKPVTQS